MVQHAPLPTTFTNSARALLYESRGRTSRVLPAQGNLNNKWKSKEWYMYYCICVTVLPDCVINTEVLVGLEHPKTFKILAIGLTCI